MILICVLVEVSTRKLWPWAALKTFGTQMIALTKKKSIKLMALKRAGTFAQSLLIY